MIKSITYKVSARLAAGAVGVAMLVAGFGAAAPALAAGLTPSQVSSILSLLQSFGADQATINNVNSALNGQASPGTPNLSCSFTFTRNLKQGSSGSDVLALQQFLNKDAATQVASVGAGSPGLETSFFGGLTKAAVIRFQQKYAAQVLTPNGLTLGTGFFGASSRAQANALCTAVVVTPPPVGGTTTPPAGGTTTNGTATITAAAQPANGIAPNNAARIPFTRFTIAATGGDVTLNSVTVERDGIAQDAAFSGVMLLDPNGNQVGISRTLNSNHQTVVGAPIVIPSGTSMTFTVAANRGTTQTFTGQVASFAVVAVNANAAITGSLPITGASYTINETVGLIGSVTAQKGTNDPGSANTENVGQLNYIFSSIRLTAGSQEQVNVKSIRWHQTGSVSQSYLANVVSVVDGVSYPTTVTTDGYYLTNFPGTGILLDKGNSKDFAIQGDIVNGSNTTVVFDIQKSSDINAVGVQFGFGILPQPSSDSTKCLVTPLQGGGVTSTGCGAVKSSDDPYYAGFTASVNPGTITVSASNGISASNVALNQQNQVIAGYNIQVQGEPINIGKMQFNVTENSANATFADLTSISLVDQSGKVLAGPVDATNGNIAGAGSAGLTKALVTFTDQVTLPVGITTVFLKAKIGINFVTNDTITASTTPSTQWTSVTGQTTGRSLTIAPNSPLTSATQTVKAAALSFSISSVPIAQIVIAGSSQFTFANVIVDATASGEDIRLTTLPIEYTFTGNSNDLTNCQIYNGSTSVSDQHIFNPVADAVPKTTQISFALNSGGVVIPKGSTATLAVKCDLRNGATGTYRFGFSGAGIEVAGASGVSSGQSVPGFFANSAGNLMTANSGGLVTVSTDASTPTHTIASAGSTGVDLGHVRFSATTEALDLRQVALVLNPGVASTSATASRTDLVNSQVTLWDAQTNTQVGTAVFPTGVNATSSQIATGAFRIPSNSSRTLIIKGDLSGISVNGPITKSGDEVVVGLDNNNVTGTNGTYAVGVSSGQNVSPATTTATVAGNGVTVYKSFPTFTYDTTSGVLTSGNQTLLTLNVAADAKGDVRLGQLKFNVALSTSDLTAITFTGPNGAVGSTTQTVTGAGGTVFVEFDSTSNTSDRIVAAGTTKTYVLRATANPTGGTNNSGTVSVSLIGDTARLASPSAGNGLASSSQATSTPNLANLVWSPLSTTTTSGAITDNDWTNSFGLGGCFLVNGLGSNCTAHVLSK